MKNIKGDNHKGYCQSSQQCVLDDNGLPEPGCKFCVDERGNTDKGSIMGKPEISSVGKRFTRVYKLNIGLLFRFETFVLSIHIDQILMFNQII